MRVHELRTVPGGILGFATWRDTRWHRWWYVHRDVVETDEMLQLRLVTGVDTTKVHRS